MRESLKSLNFELWTGRVWVYDQSQIPCAIIFFWFKQNDCQVNLFSWETWRLHRKVAITCLAREFRVENKSPLAVQAGFISEVDQWATHVTKVGSFEIAAPCLVWFFIFCHFQKRYRCRTSVIRGTSRGRPTLVQRKKQGQQPSDGFHHTLPCWNADGDSPSISLGEQLPVRHRLPDDRPDPGRWSEGNDGHGESPRSRPRDEHAVHFVAPGDPWAWRGGRAPWNNVFATRGQSSTSVQPAYWTSLSRSSLPRLKRLSLEWHCFLTDNHDIILCSKKSYFVPSHCKTRHIPCTALDSRLMTSS